MNGRLEPNRRAVRSSSRGTDWNGSVGKSISIWSIGPGKPELNTEIVRRCEVMIRRVCLLLLVTAALVGCGGPQEKRYQFAGTVTALDPANKTATIQAGHIGDWMDAMTM